MGSLTRKKERHSGCSVAIGRRQKSQTKSLLRRYLCATPLLLSFVSYFFRDGLTVTAFLPLTFPRSARLETRVADFQQQYMSNADDDGIEEESDQALVTSNDVKSGAERAAQEAWSGVNRLAYKGGSGVKKVAKGTWSGVNKLAAQGGSDVKNVVRGAWSGVNEVATKGGSDMTAVAQGAWSGVNKLVQRATFKAESATSSLTSVVQRGQSDAINLVQWMDNQAKEGASTANSQARDFVILFTGKDDYQFGDISKEIFRRASSSDVSIADVMLLLRVLLTVGASFSPLAKLLPITVLLEMMNVSIETRIGGKILEVLAGSLDDRLTAAFKAEEIGEFAKRSLVTSIAVFTGKKNYKEGDIERAVAEMDDGEKDETGIPVPEAGESSAEQEPKTLDINVGPEFQAWDQQFRESNPEWQSALEESLNSGEAATSGGVGSKELDVELINELGEWDSQFQAIMYPEHAEQ